MSTSSTALISATKLQVTPDSLPLTGVASTTPLLPSFGKKNSTQALLSVVKAHSDFKLVPLPGQMAFNDTQTAYWIAHTPPHVSRQEKKLVDLRKIAYAQEKAGLHFKDRRSVAEAKLAVLQEQVVQSSQAGQIQNPLRFAANTIKNLVDGIFYYIQSSPSIANLVDQFSLPIGDIKFYTRKSNALSDLEAAGETISTFGVGLVDSGHYSIQVQHGIKVFLENNFNPERGDIFLLEAVFIYEISGVNETIVKPTVDQHHLQFCMGVPLQSCQFFREPEKELELLAAVMLKRRNVVNKAYDFLMNAIPPLKAREARQKLEKRNSRITTADTEFKVELMIKYQYDCDTSKKKKWSRYVDLLTEAIDHEKEAQISTGEVRDRLYIQQINQVMKQLSPGARLFYTMGGDHLERLKVEIDSINTFIVDIDVTNTKDEL